MINSRGYANVVQLPPRTDGRDDPNSHAHEVWGLIYTLHPSDETSLDRYEGVPSAYTKELHKIDFWPSKATSSPASPASTPPETITPKVKQMLVYVDRMRTTDAASKDEYIHRMNRGIGDALQCGVPEAYVRTVMRKFIPGSDA